MKRLASVASFVLLFVMLLPVILFFIGGDINEEGYAVKFLSTVEVLELVDGVRQGTQGNLFSNLPAIWGTDGATLSYYYREYDEGLGEYIYGIHTKHYKFHYTEDDMEGVLPDSFEVVLKNIEGFFTRVSCTIRLVTDNIFIYLEFLGTRLYQLYVDIDDIKAW